MSNPFSVFTLYSYFLCRLTKNCITKTGIEYLIQALKSNSSVEAVWYVNNSDDQIINICIFFSVQIIMVLLNTCVHVISVRIRPVSKLCVNSTDCFLCQVER